MKQQSKSGEEVSKGFEDLKAWQLARRLMIDCHAAADQLPSSERYDLVQQIRRSSKSVMAKTISHIITAHDLKHMNNEKHLALYELSRETERTLNGYIAYVWKQKQGYRHYGDRFMVDAPEDIAPLSEPTAQ